MRDYLQTAGKGWRTAYAVACTLAAISFVLIFGVLCVAAYQQEKFRHDKAGLLSGLSIVGFVMFFTSYLAWRLWRGSASGNGVTSMPTWFIQLFGVCFLVGSVVAAFSGASKISLVENTSIGLAMIFVGRNIARRRRLRKLRRPPDSV